MRLEVEAESPASRAGPMNASGRPLVPRKQPLSPEPQDVLWSSGTRWVLEDLWPRAWTGVAGLATWDHVEVESIHRVEGGSCRVAGRRCELEQHPSSKPQLPVCKARQQWLSYAQPWVCSKAEFWRLTSQAALPREVGVEAWRGHTRCRRVISFKGLRHEAGGREPSELQSLALEGCAVRGQKRA